RDDRLLPVAALTAEASLAANLPQNLLRAHRRDLHLEDRFDRALDVDLVGVTRHLEQVLVPHLAEDRPLLGDERAPHDGPRILHRAQSSFMRSSAAEVTTTDSQWSNSYALSWSATVVVR